MVEFVHEGVGAWIFIQRTLIIEKHVRTVLSIVCCVMVEVAFVGDELEDIVGSFFFDTDVERLRHYNRETSSFLTHPHRKRIVEIHLDLERDGTCYIALDGWSNSSTIDLPR